ncbi:MAG: NAD(+) diphosphatase [Emcibacter sp.]|nr:NAD(+) diphosphatase [Emcibacter sp.]
MITDNCIFSGFSLNPSDHLRGNEAWLSERLEDHTSRFLLYSGGRPLMDISDNLRPAYKTVDQINSIMDQDVATIDWATIDWAFMGLDGDVAFFALGLAQKIATLPHEKFIDLRSAALQICADGFDSIPALLGRGKMLLEWNGRRHFCSCCGGMTKVQNGGYIRKCIRDGCGAEHFPRTDPVVIMLVICGDQCLMGRGIGWPERNYSALAGFMEPGETIEEATRREVFEEVGIKIGDVHYKMSQPWPFPSSLMIGVFAHALTTEIILDENELVDAIWIEKQQLREIIAKNQSHPLKIPPKIAIARNLLEEWLKQD